MPENASFITLGFRNTTGPNLQDITLLQPSYNLTSKFNFTNLISVHLSKFSILRFMDWTGINGNPEVNWNDTTPIDWAQYATRRNPWQTIPHLVNQIAKPIDIWINVPVNATDDYTGWSLSNRTDFFYCFLMRRK